MATISSPAENGKYYVYTLEYPEDYPDTLKASTIFYVGKGKEKKWGQGRIIDHEQEARKGHASYKCNVIRKIWAHGQEVAKRKLAHFATGEEALQYEIALIFFLPNLTNQTAGGEGLIEPSEEVRRKIGESSKGRKMPPHSEEHLRKLSESQRGKIQSEDHRRKNSQGHIGQPAWNKGKEPSTETIERLRKMADARRGKPVTFSDEHRSKLKAARAKQVMPTGMKRSEETCRKISESQKGRPKPFSEERRNRLIEYNTSRRGKPRQKKGQEPLEAPKPLL